MKSFRDKKYKIYLSENNLTPKRSKDKMIILKDKLKHNKFSFLKYKHNNNNKKNDNKEGESPKNDIRPNNKYLILNNKSINRGFILKSKLPNKNEKFLLFNTNNNFKKSKNLCKTKSTNYIDDFINNNYYLSNKFNHNINIKLPIYYKNKKYKSLNKYFIKNINFYNSYENLRPKEKIIFRNKYNFLKINNNIINSNTKYYNTSYHFFNYKKNINKVQIIVSKKYGK